MKARKNGDRKSRSDRRRHRIRYGPLARGSDWLCAGRDGRAGLPDGGQAAEDEPGGSAAEAAAWTTPRTVFLNQLGRGRAEQEWIRYQEDVADSQVKLTRARANLEAVGRALVEAEQRIADLKAPTADDMRTRVSGEEHTDAAVVAERRKFDYTERRSGLAAEVTRIRATLAERDAEIAELRERIRIRFERARTGADVIGAYVQRRCAAYLTRLVRKHPEGKQISALIRSGWHDRPRWSTWDAPPEIAEGCPPASSSGGA
jgi:hypothetical protein